MAPRLVGIRIYPIKSLDPLVLSEVEVGVRSLREDRRFAMFTADGAYMNGKRSGRVNELRTTYDLHAQSVTLGGETFAFADRARIDAFLSEFFHEPIALKEDHDGRFLDMPDASSVTVISTESLRVLAERIEGATLDELRLRFRSNLEFETGAAFWEERLAGDEAPVPFRVGDVQLLGVSIRARCNVPPRNPFTGVLEKSFVRQMLAARAATVPAWSGVRSLGSLYHLAINVFVPDSELGKRLRVGDSLHLQ